MIKMLAYKSRGPQLCSVSRRSFSNSFFFSMRKEEETLYQQLGVTTLSQQKEIKLAYYKMAKLHHPDF